MTEYSYSSKNKNGEDTNEYRKYFKDKNEWKEIKNRLEELEQKGRLIKISPVKTDYSETDTLVYRLPNNANTNLIISDHEDSKEIEILGPKTNIVLISKLERNLLLSAKDKKFDLGKEIRKWSRKR